MGHPAIAIAPTAVHLLGGFRVEHRETPVSLPPSAQRVIAFLALHEGPRWRDVVAGTLWPDAAEASAAASLRSALWRVRQLSPDLVHSDGSRLEITAEVDVDLRRMVTLARGLVGADPVGETLRWELLEAELLPGWYDDWVLLERERLNQLRLHALEALAERLAAAGRYGEAVDAGMLAVSGEELRESAHRVVILALLGEGNVASAIRHYRSYAVLLADRLGIEPSPALRGLIESVAAR